MTFTVLATDFSLHAAKYKYSHLHPAMFIVCLSCSACKQHERPLDRLASRLSSAPCLSAGVRRGDRTPAGSAGIKKSFSLCLPQGMTLVGKGQGSEDFFAAGEDRFLLMKYGGDV